MRLHARQPRHGGLIEADALDQVGMLDETAVPAPRRRRPRRTRPSSRRMMFLALVALGEMFKPSARKGERRHGQHHQHAEEALDDQRTVQPPSAPSGCTWLSQKAAPAMAMQPAIISARLWVSLPATLM